MINLRRSDVDPEVLLNPGDDPIGIIIDCKDNETKCRTFELELFMADLSMTSLKYHGFKNFVLFEDRDDFDIAVNTLECNGITKGIILNAGCIVNGFCKGQILDLEHITVYKVEDKVYRQYVVFDVEQYTYFQMRGEYLKNVRDLVKNKPAPELGIHYLYPTDDNVFFYDDLIEQKLPNLEKLPDEDLDRAIDIIREIKHYVK